jgi:NADH:ubiquinone oxidoreductase subunit C
VSNKISRIDNHVFFSQQLRASLPALIYSATPRNDGVLIRTQLRQFRKLSNFLWQYSTLQFRSLVDIAVVDRLRVNARFSVNYLFFSVSTNQRLLIQLSADETTTIPSLSVPFANGQRLFASAG